MVKIAIQTMSTKCQYRPGDLDLGVVPGVELAPLGELTSSESQTTPTGDVGAVEAGEYEEGGAEEAGRQREPSWTAKV